MTDPQSGWARPGQPSPGNGPPGPEPSPGGGQQPPDPQYPQHPQYQPQYPQPGQQGWGGYQGAPPPPKPGVIPLRPLGVGEILDGAVSYIRSNPLVTLGLSAVVITLSQLVQVPAQYLYFDGLTQLDPATSPTASEVAGAVGGGATAGLVGGIVQFVASTVLTGMLIVVLSRAVLGWRTDLSSTWATVRSRVVGLLGLSLLTALLLLAPLVAAAIPIAVLAAAGAPTWIPVLAGVILVPAALCVMIYLWAALAMAPPAYILEQVSVTAALSRSWQLVRPSWWRVFGILLLGGVIAVVISTIISVPFGIGGAATGLFSAGTSLESGATLGMLVLGAIGTIIAGTITSPFVAGITGLLYFDQRIRREGWDLELARAAHTPPQQPPQYQPPQYQPPPNQPPQQPPPNQPPPSR